MMQSGALICRKMKLKILSIQTRWWMQCSAVFFLRKIYFVGVLPRQRRVMRASFYGFLLPETLSTAIHHPYFQIIGL